MNINRKFGDRENCHLVFISLIERAQNIIETITKKFGYSYETLRELDSACITFINECFQKYKEAKFDENLSFGYLLINSFIRLFNSKKDDFNELVYDCNFYDLFNVFVKLTVIYEQMLEKEVMSAKREFKNKMYDKAMEFIYNYIAEHNIEVPVDGPATDEIVLKMLHNRFIDADFFDDALNNAFFYDTFINKIELKRKMNEVEAELFQKLNDIKCSTSVERIYH